MRARDEPRGTIVAGGACASHKEPDSVIASYLVRGNGRVVDMADDVVSVEGLRAGTGPNFEHGGVVQLGVAGALLLFVAELEVRNRLRSAIFLGSHKKLGEVNVIDKEKWVNRLTHHCSVLVRK